MKPRAVLTGATGFLGIHILPALLRAGFEVRILARHDPSHPAWDGLAFETVRGSLEDPVALTALVQGADVVVHSAGLIKARSPAEFLRVNRDGTASLARITRAEAPVAKFMLISSLAAREPGLSPYAFSKRQAELAAEEIFADVAGQLAILRPAAIYGPWDKATLAFFAGTLRRFAPVAGHGRVTIVHAADAAGAIAALAQHWHPGRFALADGQPGGYVLRDLLLAAARATGGTPRLVQMPGAWVLAAAGAVWLWTRLTGQVQIFGPGKAREILHPDWTVSEADLLPTEVYQPRYEVEVGFAETVAWYRAAGWL